MQVSLTFIKLTLNVVQKFGKKSSQMLLLEIDIHGHCIVAKEYSQATLLKILTLLENIQKETKRNETKNYIYDIFYFCISHP